MAAIATIETATSSAVTVAALRLDTQQDPREPAQDEPDHGEQAERDHDRQQQALAGAGRRLGDRL